MPLQCFRGSIVLWVEDGIHIEHCDLTTASVLHELRVVDAAMVIYDIDRFTVLTHDEVGRIAEWPTVQPVQSYFAAANNCVCRIVIRRFDRVGKGDCVQVGKSPARRQDVGLLFFNLLRAAWCCEKACEQQDPASEK